MQYYCSNAADSNYNPSFPENDVNTCSITSSKLHDPNSNNFLFGFPNSPHIHLEYEEAYNQFLQLVDQHKSMENQTHDNTPSQEITAGGGYQLPPPPPAVRKRCCKKDRHSKINTARGPRDRRMRLSLEVARKFFDLQDLLGYDKASRTVDWLIRSSAVAIRRLERSSRGGGSCSSAAQSGSASASSDGCEAVSSPNLSTTTTAAAAGAAAVEPQEQPREKPKRRKKTRAARATVERESRRRARERARERTSQKRRLLLDEITNIHQPKISGKSLTESPTAEFDDLNSETRANAALYSATWNPSAVYQGNAGIVPHHHHIADGFDCGQAWEAAYNSTGFDVSG